MYLMYKYFSIILLQLLQMHSIAIAPSIVLSVKWQLESVLNQGLSNWDNILIWGNILNVSFEFHLISI